MIRIAPEDSGSPGAKPLSSCRRPAGLVYRCSISVKEVLVLNLWFDWARPLLPGGTDDDQVANIQSPSTR